jgi:transposase
MRERQTYLRQLSAQLGVVFPEHKDALGDLLTARARGVLRAYPTAQHVAGATPRAIHHAAHSAGARGFTVEDATRVRDLARQSIYSGKAARARGDVVRTLVTQIERLLVALEELDATMVAELPPPPVGGGPSDADLLQSLPGVGAHTVATLLGELGTLSRFASGKALVAYVGFYPTLEQSGQRTAVARLVALGSRIARRALYLTAVNAIRGSAEWRTLYVRKTAQGKKPKQALIVVAVKLLHTMYAMLRDRRPYHAARLLVAPMATVA